MNLSTKVVLNGVIGSGWKLTVDAVYAMILKEECGWINVVKEVIEWVF